jgi:hypothetical protein
MGGDLIALVLALGLGVVVVVLGLRRNLSATTRDGLPRFGGVPDTPTVGMYEGEERRGRSLTTGQRRLMISVYLLMSLNFAAFAVLSAHDRLLHSILAASFALNAVVIWRRRSPSSRRDWRTPSPL